MTATHSIDQDELARWPAVFSLFLGVTGLIAAEFTPVSLLTPIAADLRVTEGTAGQAVTVVGLFAVVTSLLLPPLAKRLNKRSVLLVLSTSLIVSNLIVAFCTSYHVLLLGRGLLGVCVGGFWSMASAVTLRLVPTRAVPRALSIVYAGVSVATILSLPLASRLGEAFGWREVFVFSAFLNGVTLAFQFLTLPSLPAGTDSGFGAMFALMRKPWFLVGIAGTVFSYGGYHVFFTYLRPFLEGNLALSPDHLSAVLLVFGLANTIGTFAAGFVLGKGYRTTMIAVHLTLAATAVALFLLSRSPAGGVPLVVLWGFLFGFIPVGWSTWITRTLADRAEAASGLSVASIQFSMGLAAGVGGLMFDTRGVDGIFLMAAVYLVLAAAFIAHCFARSPDRANQG